MSLPDKNELQEQKVRRHALGFTGAQRLLEAHQFRRVFESNVKVGDRYWTILYRANQGPDARLGMAVAKKRVKRAVDRSRLKRLIRESFRHRELPSVDIVVMPRDGTVKASTRDLQNSLNKQWSRIAEQCAR